MKTDGEAGLTAEDVADLLDELASADRGLTAVLNGRGVRSAGHLWPLLARGLRPAVLLYAVADGDPELLAAGMAFRHRRGRA